MGIDFGVCDHLVKLFPNFDVKMIRTEESMII